MTKKETIKFICQKIRDEWDKITWNEVKQKPTSETKQEYKKETTVELSFISQ